MLIAFWDSGLLTNTLRSNFCKNFQFECFIDQKYYIVAKHVRNVYIYIMCAVYTVLNTAQ